MFENENEHVKVNLNDFEVNCHGLLAIINKYGITIRQWAWLCQALSDMSKKTMWIFCADDRTVEWAVIASIVNSVHVDDWTAEWVIITSNVNSVCVDDWTVERAIIASSPL